MNVASGFIGCPACGMAGIPAPLTYELREPRPDVYATAEVMLDVTALREHVRTAHEGMVLAVRG